MKKLETSKTIKMLIKEISVYVLNTPATFCFLKHVCIIHIGYMYTLANKNLDILFVKQNKIFLCNLSSLLSLV
jgi:hypothetical protein